MSSPGCISGVAFLKMKGRTQLFGGPSSLPQRPNSSTECRCLATWDTDAQKDDEFSKILAQRQALILSVL